MRNLSAAIAIGLLMSRNGADGRPRAADEWLRLFARHGAAPEPLDEPVRSVGARVADRLIARDGLARSTS